MEIGFLVAPLYVGCLVPMIVACKSNPIYTIFCGVCGSKMFVLLDISAQKMKHAEESELARIPW